MDNSTQSVFMQALGLLVRHGLTTLAGLLVGWGALSQTQSANFIDIGVGVILFAAGAGWSWAQKQAQNKKVEQAQDKANKLQDHVEILKDQLPKAKGGNL